MLASHEIVRSLGNFLPRLLVTLVIIVVGWLIAALVRMLLRSFLRLIRFDRLSEHAGANEMLQKAALPCPSDECSPALSYWVDLARLRAAGHQHAWDRRLPGTLSNFFGFLPRLL